MHITPFGEKHFHLYTLLAISMAECLVANKTLYCILYCRLIAIYMGLKTYFTINETILIQSSHINPTYNDNSFLQHLNMERERHNVICR